MAFTASAIFQQAMLNPLLGRAWTTAAQTGYGSLSADTINVALFGNSGTPSKSVTAANSAYNADQWVTGNETNGGANWPAGGLPLASKAFTIDSGSSSVCFQAVALAGSGNVTVTACYGCLVYDHTISSPQDMGLCYNYFGGSTGVVSGTYTINWATVGALTNKVVWNVTV